MIHSETFRHAVAKVVENNIACLDESVERRPPALVFEVEGDAPLAAVEAVEIGRLAIDFRARHVAPQVGMLGRFDLDHVGARSERKSPQ